jgi:hypothetical protein
MSAPTKAQRELLRYMIERDSGVGFGQEWSGGDLIAYYRARTGSQDRWGGSPSNHGRRRAGGRALRLLADAGYMRVCGSTWGVPHYRLTDEGRAAAA